MTKLMYQLFLSIAICSIAKALPPSEFDESAFYKITTKVDGQDLAITFVPPGDKCQKSAQTTCPSDSRVELQKFKNLSNQSWQIVDAKVDPGHLYYLYSKLSDQDSRLTGLLFTMQPDNRFEENDPYKEKYNRVSVRGHVGESTEAWKIEKIAGGKFRITNLKGVKIKGPKEEPYPSTWNEARSLEGYKGANGKYEVRHAKDSKSLAQSWEIVKLAP